MKKLMTTCLTVVMLFTLCVSVYATQNGGFISSPSFNDAPKVEKFEPEDEDCVAQLIITPFAERDKLSDAMLSLIEKAYESIKKTDDLTKLNESLKKLAEKNGIAGKNLAVSHLFNAHPEGCDSHEGHQKFHVVLDVDTLKNFVALMYMNENGEWVLVEDAKVTGNTLEFTTDEFSPFAIIVDTTSNVQTGDDSNIHIYVIVMLISAATIVAIVVNRQKTRA